MSDEISAMTSTRFEYSKFTEESQVNLDTFKDMIKQLECRINFRLGKTREASLALTKLEECYMWIGKAIKVDQEINETKSTIFKHAKSYVKDN